MTLLRGLAVLICLVFGFQIAAQEGDQPQVQVTLSDAPYVVGQPVTLRVKILVPTWMPKPPVYPNFEQPGLMVRLPEKSTSPISETLSGQTWSGTSRRYTIYPLEAATYRIPAQQITLTYADEKAQPVQVDLTLDPIEFRAVLPEGAREMKPPVIVATGFSLEQELVETGQMAVGDTITRRVTARIDGTTAILIPALVPALIETANDEDPEELPPLRAYPKDPTIDEAEASGILSGRRSEEITYLAQSGGSVTLPSIEIDWFNLATNTIETARLKGQSIQIAEPPAPPMERRQLVLLALTVLASLGLLVWLVRMAWPRLQQGVETLLNRWRGSEYFARRAVKQAITSQDLTRLMVELTLWRGHYPDLSLEEMQDFDQALAGLGRGIYGPKGDDRVGQADQDWGAVAQQFKTLCGNARKQGHLTKAASALPEINP